MRSTDTSHIPASARGDVVLSLYAGGRIGAPVVARHNSMSYAAADAVAAAYGGNPSMAPKYIGFLYGSSDSPVEIADPSDRRMEWDDIADETLRIGGNILVSRFMSPPEVSCTPPESSAEDAAYHGNSVTFRACTRSGSAGEYAFDTSGSSGYAVEFGDGMYLYHALLLGDAGCVPCGARKRYSVLGRVSLDRGGRFRTKPEDYELALGWKVTFF